MPPSPETFARCKILTGPTASGKTALALRLAPLLNAEIVAMDSMTLYRGMDIGTAKPTAEERRLVPHHLLDVLDPWQSANVAWWLAQAAEVVQSIESRGKTVLFVGGTPLYIKALLCGLFEGPPVDAELRQRLEAAAEAEGGPALHARLATVDPESARRLHPNDVRRIVRALEVYEQTGRPIGDWQQQWQAGPADNSAKPQAIWLDLPRALLYDRINRRVEQMMEHGLLDEVRQLRDLPNPLSREARQALGYKELFDHLDGLARLEIAVEQIQTRTRQFAKRQITWFRHLPNCIPANGYLTFARWGLKIEE